MLAYTLYLLQGTVKKKRILGAKIAGSAGSCFGTSALASISFVAAAGGVSAAQPFTAPQGRASYCVGTDLPVSL